MRKYNKEIQLGKSVLFLVLNATKGQRDARFTGERLFVFLSSILQNPLSSR